MPKPKNKQKKYIVEDQTSQETKTSASNIKVGERKKTNNGRSLPKKSETTRAKRLNNKGSRGKFGETQRDEQLYRQATTTGGRVISNMFDANIDNSLVGSAYSLIAGGMSGEGKKLSDLYGSYNPYNQERITGKGSGLGRFIGTAVDYGLQYKAFNPLFEKGAEAIMNGTKLGNAIKNSSMLGKIGQKAGAVLGGDGKAVVKTASDVGKDLLTATVGDATLGVAQNFAMDYGGEGLRGKDLARQMAIDEAMDFGLGGLMEGLPYLKGYIKTNNMLDGSAIGKLLGKSKNKDEYIRALKGKMDEINRLASAKNVAPDTSSNAFGSLGQYAQEIRKVSQMDDIAFQKYQGKLPADWEPPKTEAPQANAETPTPDVAETMSRKRGNTMEAGSLKQRATRDKWRGVSWNDVKKLCKENGIPVKGNKESLIGKLEEAGVAPNRSSNADVSANVNAGTGSNASPDDLIRENAELRRQIEELRNGGTPMAEAPNPARPIEESSARATAPEPPAEAPAETVTVRNTESPTKPRTETPENKPASSKQTKASTSKQKPAEQPSPQELMKRAQEQFEGSSPTKAEPAVKANEAKQSGGFSVGQRVHHGHYGDGKIVGFEDALDDKGKVIGKNARAIVEFDSGEKQAIAYEAAQKNGFFNAIDNSSTPVKAESQASPQKTSKKPANSESAPAQPRAEKTAPKAEKQVEATTPKAEAPTPQKTTKELPTGETMKKWDAYTNDEMKSLLNEKGVSTGKREAKTSLVQKLENAGVEPDPKKAKQGKGALSQRGKSKNKNSGAKKAPKEPSASSQKARLTKNHNEYPVSEGRPEVGQRMSFHSETNGTSKVGTVIGYDDNGALVVKMDDGKLSRYANGGKAVQESGELKQIPNEKVKVDEAEIIKPKQAEAPSENVATKTVEAPQEAQNAVRGDTGGDEYWDNLLKQADEQADITARNNSIEDGVTKYLEKSAKEATSTVTWQKIAESLKKLGDSGRFPDYFVSKEKRITPRQKRYIARFFGGDFANVMEQKVSRKQTKFFINEHKAWLEKNNNAVQAELEGHKVKRWQRVELENYIGDNTEELEKVLNEYSVKSPADASNGRKSEVGFKPKDLGELSEANYVDYMRKVTAMEDGLAPFAKDIKSTDQVKKGILVARETSGGRISVGEVTGIKTVDGKKRAVIEYPNSKAGQANATTEIDLDKMVDRYSVMEKGTSVTTQDGWLPPSKKLETRAEAKGKPNEAYDSAVERLEEGGSKVDNATAGDNVVEFLGDKGTSKIEQGKNKRTLLTKEQKAARKFNDSWGSMSNAKRKAIASANGMTINSHTTNEKVMEFLQGKNITPQSETKRLRNLISVEDGRVNISSRAKNTDVRSYLELNDIYAPKDATKAEMADAIANNYKKGELQIDLEELSARSFDTDSIDVDDLVKDYQEFRRLAGNPLAQEEVEQLLKGSKQDFYGYVADRSARLFGFDSYFDLEDAIDELADDGINFFDARRTPEFGEASTRMASSVFSRSFDEDSLAKLSNKRHNVAVEGRTVSEMKNRRFNPLPRRMDDSLSTEYRRGLEANRARQNADVTTTADAGGTLTSSMDTDWTATNGGSYTYTNTDAGNALPRKSRYNVQNGVGRKLKDYGNVRAKNAKAGELPKGKKVSAGDKAKSKPLSANSSTMDVQARFGESKETKDLFEIERKLQEAKRNGNVSQTLDTFIHSQDLDSRTKKAILNLQENLNAFGKDTIRNKDVLAKAERMVADDFEGSLKSFEKRIADDMQFTSEDNAIAYHLMQKMMREGNVAQAAEIASKVSSAESAVGRGLQSMRMWHACTPEGRVSSILRNIKKLEKRFSSRNIKIEIGTDGEAILKRVFDAKTDEELYKASNDFAVHVWNQIPPSLSEKATAWRYLSMLYNPKTWIRNAVGNVAMMGTKRVSDVFASGIEKAYTKTSRYKGLEGADQLSGRHAVLNRFDKVDKARYDLGIEQFQKHRDKLLAESSKYFDNARPIESPTFNKGRTKLTRKLDILNRGMRFNDKMLNGGDVVFMRPNYASAFGQYLKANNIKPSEITDEVLEQANKYAQEMAQRTTFRDANKLADALNNFRRKLEPNAKDDGLMRIGRAGARLVTDATVPFVRTPMNILKRGTLEYSPVGLVRGALQMVNAKNAKEAMDGIEYLANGLTGTGLFGLGYVLCNKGLLTGSSGDYDKKTAYDSMLGEQSYAFVTNSGASYTVDWVVPDALPLFMGVQLSTLLGEAGANDDRGWALLDSLKDMADPIFELSMLQGIENTFQMTTQGEKGLGDIALNAAGGYVSQFIPTIAGQLSRTTVLNRKTAVSTARSSSQRKIEKMIGKLINKTPLSMWSDEYASQDYVDSWGRTDSKSTGVQGTRNLWTWDSLENFFSPGYYAKENKTDVDKEILALYDRLDTENRDKIIPSVNPSAYIQKLDDKEYTMTPAEFTQYKKTVGQYKYDGLEKLFATSAYKNAEDDEKRKMIQDVYDDASKYGRREYLMKVDEEFASAPDFYSLDKKTREKYSKTLSVSEQEWASAYRDMLDTADERKRDTDTTLTADEKRYILMSHGLTSYEDAQSILGANTSKSAWEEAAEEYSDLRKQYPSESSFRDAIEQKSIDERKLEEKRANMEPNERTYDTYFKTRADSRYDGKTISKDVYDEYLKEAWYVDQHNPNEKDRNGTIKQAEAYTAIVNLSKRHNLTQAQKAYLWALSQNDKGWKNKPFG